MTPPAGRIAPEHLDVVGKQLGPYRILEPLGAGGMGEVYLAEDTRLQRKVAVKVLPATFAADPDRLSRFEQEARAAAALNHPNIAAIHDVGQATEGEATVHYMVQEYLRGKTLREVLQGAALPLNKALTLATEIAEALRAAHQAGIVHRDLKPENLFVTEDGHVKVLDFGLAKLVEAPGADGAGPTMSPTVTSAGQILGTAGYMAPEQVEGGEVDHRVDLFALGCVVYEMTACKRAFSGSNVHETLSRILSGQPERVSEARDGLPVKLQWLLDKMLAKDREMRYQTAGDALVDLKMLLSEVESGAALTDAAAPAGEAAPAGRRPSWPLLVLGAAFFLVAGSAVTWWTTGSPTPLDEEVVRFDIVLPEGAGFSSNYNRVLAISPDGKHMALNVDEQLWLREIQRSEPTPIADTANARTPFFSPDGRELGFWADGQIKRIRLDGGVPATVGSFRQRPFGASWAEDGYIYVGRADQGIWRLPASGGEPEQVISLEPGEMAHGPVLLPGGEWLLFGVTRGVRTWRNGSIVAQSLAGGERKALIERGREVRHARNGHLLYVEDSNLFAVPFDAERVELTGGPSSMDVAVNTSALDETGAANYDISHDGTLMHRPPQGSGLFDLAWLTPDGKEEVLPMEARPYVMARLSPDDRQVAAQIDDTDGSNIWIYQVDRGGGQRLTSTAGNRDPVWSHDGAWVYFGSDRGGNFDIWRRRADRGAPAELFLEAEGDQVPRSVSSDGKWLLFEDQVPSNSDIGRVSLDDERIVEPLIQTPADEVNASFSPDGRYVVFQSNEDPRWDAQVMDIATGSRWTISADGGYQPVWVRNGSRIIYTDESLSHVVEVSTDPEFAAAEPEAVFDVKPSYRVDYDVARDGSKLLVVRPHDEQGPGSADRLTVGVVLNWFEEIEARR